jgi:hypothetical protein
MSKGLGRGLRLRQGLSLFMTTSVLFGSAAFGQSGGGFIGVALSDVPGRSGALVEMVKPGAPADRAGLKVGDRVVAVNGSSIDRAATMTRIITSMSPNQTAHLTVVRVSKSFLLDVLVGGSPAGGSAADSPVSRSTPAPGGAAAVPRTASLAPLQVSAYLRIEDPIERAFTADVPKDWKAEAGLARRSALQINAYARALSPDKMTYLMLGEPTLTAFTLPSPMGNTIGYGEGKLYDTGVGGLALVWHYLPGAEFARLYAQTVVQGLCPAMQIAGVQARPDLAQKAKALYPSFIPSRTDGGEVRFTCMHNKQEMEGRVDAGTVVTQVGWGVMLLGAYITPKGQGAKAAEILYHVGDSIKFNPVWQQKQDNLSQQAAVAINQRMQEILRQQESFMQKLNSVDQSFESMDELISGFSSYHDTSTGTNYSLSNTNPYKWMDPSTGRIISTATNVRPPWAPAYQAMPRGSQ